MDGVKIIADAIRKERAEKEKASQPTTPANVADITAQFTGKVENKKDTENKEQNNETKEQNKDNTEQKNESEEK